MIYNMIKLPLLLIFASFLKGFSNPKLGCVTLHNTREGVTRAGPGSSLQYIEIIRSISIYLDY